MTSVFMCDICNKQYNKVRFMQFDALTCRSLSTTIILIAMIIIT
jgi:hypothetical protein